MMPMQDCKFVVTLAPVSTNATAATTIEVDTKALGIPWCHATFIFQTGVVGAAMDELSITESDTAGSGHVAITGLTFTDPTTDNTGAIWVASVPLLGARKRYLKPVMDPGAAATLLSGLCILHRGIAPVDVTAAGVVEWLKIA